MGLALEQLRRIFVETNPLLNQVTFAQLSEQASQTQQALEELVIEKANLTTDQYLALLSKSFGVPATKLSPSEIDSELLTTVPQGIATENLVMPFAVQDGQYCIAAVDPTNQAMITAIRGTAGDNVKFFVATEADIRRALILYDGNPKDMLLNAAQSLVTQQANETQQVSQETAQPFVSSMLEAALFMGTSDIHFEPYESEIILRFRIDGRLRTITTLPASLYEPISVYLKVLAAVDIDKQHQTQDGRFGTTLKGQTINVRMSFLPTMWGQKIVMRLLAKEAQIATLADIGMLPSDVTLLKHYIAQPHGMILATGPTNSGKSTTLYASLREILLERTDSINVSTIEDPVEYTMPGVTQVQVDEHVSFGDGLRELLRQDIDVLMVGEIRDGDTAEFAVRTALVGRLVLSTLHTNDAPSTITRLSDLNIPPYLIASTLSLVIAQRLARKLCEHCREAYQPDAAVLEQLTNQYNIPEMIEWLVAHKLVTGLDPGKLTFYRAKGCATCGNSGYMGRVGVFEILEITKPIRDAIYQKVDAAAIRQIALQNGMKSMAEDALLKVLQGLIDIEQLSIATYA